MNVTRFSLLTGRENTLDLPITEAEFAAFRAGTLVQEAFPKLTAEEREFLLTGITPEEWAEQLLGGDDDESSP